MRGFYKKTLKIFFRSTLIFIILISGCAPAPGLSRTPMNRFKNVTYYSLGINIEVPRQPLNPFKKYNVTKSTSKAIYRSFLYRAIHLSFHPVRSHVLLSEPFYLLEISVVRMTQKSFDELFSKGKHDANGLSVFWHTEDNLKFHKELYEEKIKSSFLQDQGEFIFFRKDQRAPYGDYIVTGARLITNYPGSKPEEQAEDIATVKRIINSVNAYR